MDTSAYQLAKLHVVQAVGLSKDALHVYVGMLVFLAVVLLFKKPLSSLVPLVAVLGVALLGEAFDARDDIATFGTWRVGAGVHDIVNTTFWPAVLSMVARFRSASGGGRLI